MEIWNIVQEAVIKTIPNKKKRTKAKSLSEETLQIAEKRREVKGNGENLGQRRQWLPTPVLLPGKSHGRRSLVGCSPWGCEESDTTEQLHFHFSLSCFGEGNGNPLQCSCLENPRDEEAQNRTLLKWLSSSIPIWIENSKEQQGEIKKLPQWTMQTKRGKQQNGKD